MTKSEDVKKIAERNNRAGTALAFIIFGGIMCAAGWDQYEKMKLEEHQQELRKQDAERNRQLNAKMNAELHLY